MRVEMQEVRGDSEILTFQLRRDCKGALNGGGGVKVRE